MTKLSTDSLDRYSRQMRYAPIGEAGQRKLLASRALVCGCGALGSVMADQLVRAGLGFLRIVDRDTVELTNLQRQVLFDESDAADGTPKAIAAANRLRAINTAITIEPHVADVDSESIEDLMREIDVVLDGTDNVHTRYLINDAAVKHAVPWVYGACVGTEGRVMPVIPGKSACLRCVFPEAPDPGELPTCDTAGVLGPVAAMAASLQVISAIKLLLGQPAAELISFDGFAPRFRVTETSAARRADCRTCGRRQFEYLDAPAGDGARLCGRHAVQVRPPRRVSWSLDDLANKLQFVACVRQTPYLLRFDVPDCPELSASVFSDGRAIIHGTDDLGRAKSIYARFIGT
jgi:adenylyltransferase/sulfurtransferase